MRGQRADPGVHSSRMDGECLGGRWEIVIAWKGRGAAEGGGEMEKTLGCRRQLGEVEKGVKGKE